MADKIFTQGEVLNRAFVDLGDGTGRLNIAGSLSIGGTRTKLKKSQDLSLAPLVFNTGLSSDFYLRAITINVTNGYGVAQNIMEDIKIILDESDDNFDTPLIVESFIDNDGNATSSFSFFPDSDISVFASSGSDLRVEVSNNGLLGVANATIYVEVL